MKKYFCKYLPVEGHFHYVGAVIREKATGNIGIIKKVGEGVEENEHVKLFLCSRDIKIGDAVVWLNKYTWAMFQKFPVTTQEGVDIMKNDHKGKWGVVIGEISKSAVWVKEGDEFDESDWSLFGETEGIMGLSGCLKNPEYQEGYRKLYKRFVCKIKCSQCLTFH